MYVRREMVCKRCGSTKSVLSDMYMELYMDSVHQKYKAIVTPKEILYDTCCKLRCALKNHPKNLQKANFIIILACKHERARLT